MRVKIKLVQRVTALAMALVCFSTVIVQAATVSITSSSVAPQVGVEAISRADALAWVQQKVTYYGNRLVSELASATVDTGQVMTDYGCMLVYLNWAAANALDVEGIGYTVFEGLSENNVAAAKNLIDLATSLRSTIKDKNILSMSYNAATLKPNQANIVSLNLPSGSTVFATPGSLHNTATYHTLLSNIMQSYVDASILMAVGNEKDPTKLKTLNDYSSLSSAFGEEENASAAALTYIGTLRESILPYVKVYQEIYAAFVTANGRALKPEALVDDNKAEHSGSPVVNSSMVDAERIFKMSTISKEICKALTETTGDNSIGTSDGTENVRTDNGALPLISNASIINGKIEDPSEGELDLTSIGYRILAAGITYDPLVSHAGNDFYTDVILDALANEDQKEQVNTILLKALSLKKIVYVVSQQAGQWNQKTRDSQPNTTEYRIAHLSDLLYPGSEDGALNVFVVPTGKMNSQQSDSSTCEYYLNGIDSTSTEDTIVPTKDTTISVGGSTLQGDANSVSKPIAAVVRKVSSLNSGEMLGVAGLTSVLVNNVTADRRGNKYIETADTQTLFVNGLGDIVTVDGTIVLPAIANPMLFEYDAYMRSNSIVDSGAGHRDDMFTTTNASSYESKSYYPYNAAFINHYPNLALNMDLVFNTSNGEGKYIISKSGSVFKITKTSDKGVVTSKSNIIANIPNGQSLAVQADIAAVENALPIKSGTIGTGKLLLWDQSSEMALMCKENKNDSSGPPYIPLPVDGDASATRDDYIRIASALILSCTRYISTKDSATGDPVNSGVFDVERYIKELAGQGLLGTQRAEVIAKNFAVSYESIVDDTSNRFEKFLGQIIEKLLKTFGDTDGVLAIKGQYENTFFTHVVHFVQQFYPYLAVLLLIILARSFIKGHSQFLYVVVILIVSVASLNVYAYVLPDVLVNAYNVIVNDIVEKTSWSTMMNAAENYSETYGNAGRRDVATGELRPYTSTITLYRLTDYERDTLAGQLGVEARDIEAGVKYDLDADAGIFIQGNCIKQSVDLLFANNAMRGLYAAQWDAEGLVDGVGTMIPEAQNTNPYTIQLEKPYISLEAYYTPFCHIERSFLQNLNQFTNIFSVPHVSRVYGDGLYKDAFVYGAFINSGLFTAPGNDSVLKQNVSYSTAVQEILSTSDLLQLAHQYFDPQDDWLNLRSIFGNPTTSLKNSLWGQMLQKQEYYDSEWKITEEGDAKFSQLISYVNTQTKLWVINNEEELKCCSDENAIKLTALYATTAFNHKVSEIGRWLYPNYIDASPFALKDVLYGSFTSVTDRNFGADGDIANVVTLNLGVAGQLMLIFIILLSVGFIFVLTYMLPILYALLGLMVIYRLSNSETASQVVSGYVKVTSISIGTYILFAFGYRLIELNGYQWYGYLLTLFTCIICCMLLVATLTAVLLDPLTIGDSTLKNSFTTMFDKFTKGTIGALTAGALNIRGSTFDNAIFNGSFEGYSRGVALSQVPLTKGARQMRARYSDAYSVHNPLGYYTTNRAVKRGTRRWRF